MFLLDLYVQNDVALGDAGVRRYVAENTTAAARLDGAAATLPRSSRERGAAAAAAEEAAVLVSVVVPTTGRRSAFHEARAPRVAARARVAAAAEAEGGPRARPRRHAQGPPAARGDRVTYIFTSAMYTSTKSLPHLSLASSRAASAAPPSRRRHDARLEVRAVFVGRRDSAAAADVPRIDVAFMACAASKSARDPERLGRTDGSGERGYLLLQRRDGRVVVGPSSWLSGRRSRSSRSDAGRLGRAR